MFRRPFHLYRSQNPWREIDRMQREMGRLFDEFAYTPRSRMAPSFPAINVWTNEDGAVVTAELPGVNPEDIDISVVGETLKLTGSRRPEELEEGAKYHRRERGFGNFTRTFQLPFTVEADNVEAVFDKGVLHISLPRAEAEKPRKIAVKAA
ncbi:MAG TPA: Hsp20/alpha crystallin family protein [Anaerolineae bacterium]|nr:Hsp20/alpha crystallin family protein [Anaerolineae bacterium]MCB0179208.1 Hsp20/alpha crystallin family protein [Anaerolineae bacterium]MCB0224083.1 Hsp20/alpha crystallin family protein [Anaerolineae bacterium]MCB9109053.1 Hsp20/alpha crystallin family protein [Anaerolineales bacterium]HRV95156.1 Hsp20/alpha crystallin family protein [Anaerolineae bacterium]